MKNIFITIALTLLTIQAQANEVKSTSSVSWHVTAVKQNEQIVQEKIFNAPENNRTTVGFDKQKQTFNVGQTTLINQASKKNTGHGVTYKINVNPAKNKDNKQYALDLHINKTQELTEKELLQPLQIQMKNPTLNGKSISMAELPDGQYRAEMELVSEHYWL